MIDVTSWLTEFIERYPESFYIYKKEKPDREMISLYFNSEDPFSRYGIQSFH